VNITHGLRRAPQVNAPAIARSARTAAARGGKLVIACRALQQRCVFMASAGAIAWRPDAQPDSLRRVLPGRELAKCRYRPAQYTLEHPNPTS
jgi:hypothetical protein